VYAFTADAPEAGAQGAGVVTVATLLGVGPPIVQIESIL
jgi:hypothetical protein